MQYAALHWHLKVLRWAREHGCEWNAANCASDADERGHAEVGR